MTDKTFNLPPKEEMLQRLLKVDDNSHIQQKFYPPAHQARRRTEGGDGRGRNASARNPRIHKGHACHDSVTVEYADERLYQRALPRRRKRGGSKGFLRTSDAVHKVGYLATGGW